MYKNSSVLSYESQCNFVACVSCACMHISTLPFLCSRIVIYVEEISEKLAREENLTDPLMINTDSITFLGQTVSCNINTTILRHCGLLFYILTIAGHSYCTGGRCEDLSCYE